MNKKQRLIFVRKLSSIPAGAKSLAETKTVEQHQALVGSFERGEFAALYVPAGRLTGWRIKLTPDRCDVLFLDDGWTDVEMEQGKNRLTTLA